MENGTQTNMIHEMTNPIFYTSNILCACVNIWKRKVLVRHKILWQTVNIFFGFTIMINLKK